MKGISEKLYFIAFIIIATTVGYNFAGRLGAIIILLFIGLAHILDNIIIQIKQTNSKIDKNTEYIEKLLKYFLFYIKQKEKKNDKD